MKIKRDKYLILLFVPIIIFMHDIFSAKSESVYYEISGLYPTTVQIDTIQENLKSGILIYEYAQYDIWQDPELKYPINEKINYKLLFDSTHVKYAFGNDITIFDKNIDAALSLLNTYGKKTAFFTTIEREINMMKYGHYKDIEVTKTNEIKVIAGYLCEKSIAEYNGDSLIFWTTNKIKIGLQLPNTPFALDDVALEYELRGPFPSRYATAIKIKEINSIKNRTVEFDLSIPQDFDYSVPFFYSKKSPSFSENIPSHDFIKYPEFIGGNEMMFSYFYNSINITNPDDINGYATIRILENGKAEIIDILIWSDDKTYKKKIQKSIEQMPKWNPCIINGCNVRATTSFYF